jgi:hypothetical protein
LSKRPDYRAGKVQDLAHGAANFISALMAESRDALPTCLNCAYHQIDKLPDGERLMCTGYKLYPPPSIIVKGCDYWADIEGIPF